jgi:ATP synthase protein I
MVTRPVPRALRNRAAAPGARNRPQPGRNGEPNEFPLPPRGAGYTVLSYLVAGMVAYGGIGWLVGRAVHSMILFPVGMLVGLALSIGLVIHRYGRS